jgi:hypothetical protein
MRCAPRVSAGVPSCGGGLDQARGKVPAEGACLPVPCGGAGSAESWRELLVPDHPALSRGGAQLTLFEDAHQLCARRFQPLRSILTEIYICHTCSCHEILRADTPGQAAARSGAEPWLARL